MRMLPPYFKNFYKWTVWRTVYAFLGDRVSYNFPIFTGISEQNMRYLQC